MDAVGFSESSAFRNEFVFFNDRGHGHLAIVRAIDTYHASDALHSNAFRQRNLGRQGQGKADGRPLLDGRIEIKANAASAYVPQLSRLALIQLFASGGG